MLDSIVAESWFEARGVVGFWPPTRTATTSCCGRTKPHDGTRAPAHAAPADEQGRGPAQHALSDFVAPVGLGPATTWAPSPSPPGHGELQAASRFRAAGDDYSAILATSLADRLAEAFAEGAAHARAARAVGLCAGRALSSPDLLAEQYQAYARRPAIPPSRTTRKRRRCSVPAKPRSNAGMELTESFAMNPPASVSGLYFAIPQSHYFGVGKIDREQVEDYALRKELDGGGRRAVAGGPILAYDPAGRAAA
jgi:5-methyltetrahydrofolate--homocysteine methyltransferase